MRLLNIIFLTTLLTFLTACPKSTYNSINKDVREKIVTDNGVEIKRSFEIRATDPMAPVNTWVEAEKNSDGTFTMTAKGKMQLQNAISMASSGGGGGDDGGGGGGGGC